MYYKIGEVARMLGLTTPAIRFYEKYGVLPTVVDEQNGYRSYTVADMLRLLSVKAHRNCGLTLRQAAELNDPQNIDRQPERLGDMIEQREKELKKELRFLEKMQKDLDEAERARKCIGVLQEEALPAWRSWIFSDFGEKNFFAKGQEKAVSAWTEALPLVEILTVFDKTGFPALQKEHALGFAIREEDVPHWEAADKVPYRRIEGGKCLTAYIEGNRRLRPVEEYAREIFEEAARQGYTPSADPFTTTLHQVSDLQTEYYLLKLWIPIE